MIQVFGQPALRAVIMIQRVPGRFLLGIACAWGAVWSLSAGEVQTLPPLVWPPVHRGLSLEDAVRQALQANPELAAVRAQRGIAAAEVVIARTYPFNPVLQAKFQGADGPPSANVTNHFVQEYKLSLELEVRGQGCYRRQAALAGMTRAEWEVAGQEVKLASQTVLAFQEVLYRRQKLQLAEDRLRLAQETVQQVMRLRDLGKLGPADVILAHADVSDASATRQPALQALQKARANLRRALGAVEEAAEPQGSLEGPDLAADQETLLASALERRPDLHAKSAALAVAQAKVRLEQANRFGNPAIGPAYELDPSTITFIGGFVVMPVPVLNAHGGLIRLRQAEEAKAAADLRQTEIQVRQDVQAIIARLAVARSGLYTYRTQLLPELEKNLATIEKLFLAADPGVDVIRVASVRRNLLKARDAYLDSSWELSQAHADLIVAVGDPMVVLEPAQWLPNPRQQ
jgi:cobalt-zinc-cadmium efflux system outer membrane protein